MYYEIVFYNPQTQEEEAKAIRSSFLSAVKAARKQLKTKNPLIEKRVEQLQRKKQVIPPTSSSFFPSIQVRYVPRNWVPMDLRRKKRRQ